MRRLARRQAPRAAASPRRGLRIPGWPAVHASHASSRTCASRSTARCRAAAVDWLRRSRGRARSAALARAAPAFAVGRRAAARRDRESPAREPAAHADGRAAVLARRESQARNHPAHRAAAELSACPCSTSRTTSTRSCGSRPTRCCSSPAASPRMVRRPKCSSASICRVPAGRAGVVLRRGGRRYIARHRCLSLGAQRLRVPIGESRGRRHPLRAHSRARRRDCDGPAGTAQHSQHFGRHDPRDRPGASVYVELLLAVDRQHLRARITRDAYDDLALSPGRQVFALIKSVALESTCSAEDMKERT